MIIGQIGSYPEFRESIAHGKMYPDGQLRTCQRRLKGWRREAALRLVFGTAPIDVINPDSKHECPAVM